MEACATQKGQGHFLTLISSTVALSQPRQALQLNNYDANLCV